MATKRIIALQIQALAFVCELYVYLFFCIFRAQPELLTSFRADRFRSVPSPGVGKSP